MSYEHLDHLEDEPVSPPLPTYRAARVNRPEDIAKFTVLTLEGRIFDLTDDEIWWRDHYHSLLRHGYRLRHRFRPGWKPSWLGTNIDPFHCEDALVHGKEKVVDAVRIEDGSVVAIKWVKPKSKEIEIGCMLSSPERLQDPANHCTPILDSFEDEEDSNAAYIVMPLYRKFDDPPFYYVEEVVDFIRQTLEGLVYLHSQRVAHRDLADKNIMMDGNSMYPKGFHPSWQSRSKETTAYYSKYINRADAERVKYVFIDFGESTFFANPFDPPLVTGDRALDHEVPELNDKGILYNAFAVDVFTLGNVYKKILVSRYKNLDFLNPLSEAMTELVPDDRPSASEALDLFQELISKQRGTSLRWRLHPVDENIVRCIFYDIRPLFREVRHFFRLHVVQSLPVTVLLTPLRVALDLARRCHALLRSLFLRDSGERLIDSSDFDHER